MLDKLPPAARHLLLAALPVILGWVLSDVVPALQGKYPAAAALWLVLQQVLLWVLPLTRQYGAGAAQADPGGNQPGA